MKRFFILAAFLTALAGCQSVDSNVTDPSAEAHGRETFKAIEFTIRDTSATKAPTPITSLSEFNVSATTGSAGSEASKLSNVVFASSNGVFKSDAVWPSSNPGYHFYASNVAMTHTASGQTVKISTIDKDVVCAYLASPAYKVKNDLTFNHILARVGTVSFTNLDLCSNVKLSMKYSGSGTYNIGTGVWSDVGGQSMKELSTADNDFWIIPGTYDATLTYTDANGNPQSKTLKQNFLAGKVNNISAKLDGSVVVKTEDEYEAPTFTLGTISDIPAGGGDSGNPSVTSIDQRKRVKKTLADGSVKYDPDWTAVSSPNYTIQYGKTLASLSDNCPSYHGNNLGTTAKARTKLGDIYVRVKIGDKTTDKTLEVYQQANEETFGTLAVKSFSYSPKVGAAGGTASPTVTYELPYSWTSGSKGNYTSGATLAYSTVTDNAGATLNASTGVVTWAANSGTERSETERVTVSLKGKSNTKDAASTQSGDAVDHYDDPVVTLSYSGTPIAYNSTSAISPTLVVKQKVYYTSGKTPETKTLSTSEYTVSYSGSVTGLSVNSSTGSVTPTDNTGSTIAARTEYTNPSVSLSYGNIAYTGGSSSPSISYSQTKTSYTEGRNSTNARSTKVTASVTAHSKSASATADVKQNGDGGKAQTSSETTVTSGGSVSYGGSASGFSLSSGTVTAGSNVGSGGGVSYSDPTVSFSSSTTTIGYTGGSVTCNEATYSQTKTTAARNSTSSRSITVTATVTLNGKTGTKSATCTQNGDAGASKKDETITSGGSVSYSTSGTGFSNSGRTITASNNTGSTIAGKTEYSDPTITFSYSNIAYTGGSSSPSISYSQTKTVYTEGRNSTPSRSGSITATVTLNGKSGSKAINFTQNGDAGVKQTSSSSSADISKATVTYSSGYVSNISCNSSGVVTAKSNVGSGGGVSYGDPTVTFTSPSTTIGYAGGSVTCNEATYSQTETTAARNSTSSRSISVKATVKINNKSAEKTASCTQNGDPGAPSGTRSIISGGTVTYSSSGTGFSNEGRTIKATSNEGADYTNFSDPVITSFSYTTAPSSGGRSAYSIAYSQDKTTGRSSTSSRSGKITATVKLNNKTGSASIDFTQNGDAGTAETVPVTSGTPSFTFTMGYTSGATLINNTYTSGYNQGDVKWAANSSTNERSATVNVTVKLNNKSSVKSSAVSKQEGIKYSISVNPTSLTFAYDASGSGSQKTVAVTCPEGDWEISDKPSSGWSVSKSGSNIAIYPTAANTSTSSTKTGTVTVRCKGDNSKTATVSLTQEKKPVTYSISVNPTSLTFGCDDSGSGSQKTVAVTCPEGDWEISSTTSGWTASKSGSNIVIYPNAKNTSTTTKTGTVTVRCKGDNSKTATVNLSQDAPSYEIDVE